MAQWLDDYTTNLKFAYSNHKLLTAYAGDCCQLDYDGDTWQIGWDGNWRDDATLLDNLSTGPNDPGTIKIWYEQSGNGVNLSQSSNGLQPHAAPDENSVYTITGDAAGATARPTMYFIADYWSATLGASTSSYTMAAVVQRVSAPSGYGPIAVLAASYSTGPYSMLTSDFSSPDAVGLGPNNLNLLAGMAGSRVITSKPEVLVVRYNTSTGVASLFLRDVLVAESENTYTPNLTTLIVGQWLSSTNTYKGKLSELIGWTTAHDDETCQAIAREMMSVWEIEPIIGAGGGGGGRRPRMVTVC